MRSLQTDKIYILAPSTTALKHTEKSFKTEKKKDPKSGFFVAGISSTHQMDSWPSHSIWTADRTNQRTENKKKSCSEKLRKKYILWYKTDEC